MRPSHAPAPLDSHRHSGCKSTSLPSLPSLPGHQQTKTLTCIHSSSLLASREFCSVCLLAGTNIPLLLLARLRTCRPLFRTPAVGRGTDGTLFAFCRLLLFPATSTVLTFPPGNRRSKVPSLPPNLTPQPSQRLLCQHQLYFLLQNINLGLGKTLRLYGHLRLGIKIGIEAHIRIYI